LSEYERKPLLDKALSATFPPGSTFKTMTALAALTKGVDPNKTYVCNGAWFWGGRVWHCDKHHGVQNMHSAIASSCDIFFYQTALEVGPELLSQTAHACGLGQLFDIGISGQKRGIVPSPAWKREYFKNASNPEMRRWWPGETPSFGIGQGALAVNPLQLCVMAARLANSKKALNPRLIKSVGGRELPSGAAVPDLPFAPEHLTFVREAMAEVTASGTAAAVSDLGLGPIKMAGKTGTAQAHSYGSGSRATLHLDWEKRDHAWFICFAPYDDPRYACSVLVQHGGWGASAAAPRAREVMRVALLKDPDVVKRVQQPLPMPRIDPAAPAEGRAPPPPTEQAT